MKSCPLSLRNLFLIFLFFAVIPSYADETIGFIETFALAEDRAAAIEELVPGTENFYYFKALLAQQGGENAEVAALLEPWIKRHGRTSRVVEIEHREALLQYTDNPQLTLAYLKKQLGLTFNHQQQRLDAKPDFPTKIDPKSFSWESFRDEAMRKNDLGQFTESGLDRLIREETPLNPAQRRDLLGRIEYADAERLVGVIAADLRTKESGGFGEFPVHRNLTLSQLDELAGLIPELESAPIFVETRLAKIQPGEDELISDPVALQAHLDRVWDYVTTLPPSFADVRAAVLYQRLELARSQGNYPREEFLLYLSLPRPMPYMRQDYVRDQRQRGISIQNRPDLLSPLGLTPLRNDEGLVRDYLDHFFVEEGQYTSFSNFVKEDYLKRVFAETKLLNGIGNAEKWFSMLSPGQVQTLKERIEIAFSPENRREYPVAESVDLTAGIKNVKELLVKVYEVNALNFYLNEKREINTDLNLDGLIANEEKRIVYDQPSMLRHVESFSFESMKGRRGVWVVELIGNGISSRALVRKGKLQYLSKTTVGGELVTILDEANEPVENAAIWFGGKRYKALENGDVLLPFSTQGSASVVLEAEGQASFATLEMPQEQYQFEAGFFLEMERLLPGLKSEVIVRPSLTLNGEPISLAAVENVSITVTTTDLDGVSSVSEDPDFPLLNDREAVHSFRVPNRLQEINVTLNGEISPVSRGGEPIKVSASRGFEVAGVDQQGQIADTHLTKIGGEYFIEVLGLAGEVISDQAVNVELAHQDTATTRHFSLRSDTLGRIGLGDLSEVTLVVAQGNGMIPRRWPLRGGRDSVPSAIHAKAGDSVLIPVALKGGKLTRSDFAIFEIRKDQVVRDVFDLAKEVGGGIELSDLAPGDYRAILKREGTSVQIRVTDSSGSVAGYELSEHRHLQVRNPKPLLIESLERAGDKVVISVANAGESTRVHLFATRYEPYFDAYSSLNFGYEAAPFKVIRGSNESQYISGRDIGEEYRYILERRGEKRFPGNMLTRPGLILNPWELNETSTETDVAAKGEAYKRSRDLKEGGKKRSAPGSSGMGMDTAMSLPNSNAPSLQFSANQPLVLSNLVVGEDGKVSIDVADLGDRQHLHVLAVNPYNTSSRDLSLAEPDGGIKKRDIRLQQTLNPEKDFTERRNVTLLETGDTLVIDDLRSSELETYDTVAGVYSTLLGIKPDLWFTEFGFVTDWPTWDEAKKRELYSKYGSHELNFFLSRKDPDFFQTVAQPYLRNKKDKTFMDHYLVEEDLESYLEPWKFGRLNIVERILLARRIGGGELNRTGKHVSSLHELIRPNPGQDAFVFRQALRGRRSGGLSLGLGRSDGDAYADVGDSFGFSGAMPAPVAALSRFSAKPQMAGGGTEAQAMMSADAFAAPPSEIATIQSPLARGNVAMSELREEAVTDALYQRLESTKEWAENNYYHLPIEQQLAELVIVNGFWKDFANWNGKGGFYSREFPAATGSFTEMMFALSVLDLPFSAEEHDFTVEDNALRLTANSPLVVFHEEVKEASRADEITPILVSQNYFRSDDRHQYVDGQQIDKFVTEEFLRGVVYGSQIVVTNPTSSAHRLDLLVQIPEGAIPVSGSDYTRSSPVQLNPFSTERVEVAFYFSKTSGEASFPVYPVRVSKNEEVIAVGVAITFRVVDQLSKVDEASWEYLSQYGSRKQILDYLEANNLERIDLSRIAWLAREDVDFCKQAVKLIGSHHAYDETLWSYGIHHNLPGTAGEYLKHREDFIGQAGLWIESDLVSVEPVERHWYEHLEYSPLVNARRHQLGRERKVLNDRFREQYGEFLEVASYKAKLSDEDALAVSAYLFLQDRIGEGLVWLKKVNPENLTTKLQFNYLKAYGAMYENEVGTAKAIAANYLDYPVERWRSKFAEIDSQVKAIEGAATDGGSGDAREEQIEKLSAADSLIDLTANGREAKLVYRGVDEIVVNYYEMDLEFLFSSKPFVSGGSSQFSVIKPNASERRKLPEKGDSIILTLPKVFESKNVLVEVVAAGRTESVAIYSNQLKVQVSENYGRIEVAHGETGEALSAAYVKVYAKMKNGEVRFFKDGYTDLRGRLDYTSLSTNEIDEVEKLSLLVMSDEHGSLVREVKPPQR